MNGNDNNARRAILAVVAVTLLITSVPGCIWAPELARLRNDIERQIPGARFEKEFAISLGPISLAFARMVTAMVPDAREARGYLKDVSKVQVAVYNAYEMPPISGVRMPDQLERMREKENWEVAVKVRDDEELVWVMYRIDDEKIKDLYVVVLNDEELVLVKARGNLENLVARAMSEAGDHKGIPHVDEWDEEWHSVSEHKHNG